MLKKLSDFFSKGRAQAAAAGLPEITVDKDGKPVSEEAIVAISALLVYLASADDQIAKEEAESICMLLAFNLSLEADLIPVLVQKSVEKRREVEKLEEFSALINNSYSINQRVRILAMCWKLILSDNKLEKPEEKMLVRISTSMFLSIDQQNKARSFAEEGLV